MAAQLFISDVDWYGRGFQFRAPFNVETTEVEGLYPHHHYAVNVSLKLTSSELMALKESWLLTVDTQIGQLMSLSYQSCFLAACETHRYISWPVPDRYTCDLGSALRYDPSCPSEVVRYDTDLSFRLVPRFAGKNYILWLTVPSHLDFNTVKDWERALLEDRDAAIPYQDWLEENKGWEQRQEMLRATNGEVSGTGSHS
jgi:hypothetical protein